MKSLFRIRYIIAAVAVGLILFWIFYRWSESDSYIESEYFINYFPFADRSSVLEGTDFHEAGLKLKELDIKGARDSVIRFPLNCRLDYYLKIPRDASLKIFLKHYGSKHLKTVEEVKVSIQEEDKPSELLQSIKFPKGIIKNDWRSEQVSLDRYSDKIVKLSFSAVRYGGIFKHPEGFFFRPLLMIDKHLIQSQAEETHPVELGINPERLRRTNVIMIVLDAARADHFGCYGYHRKTTPHIDRLAKESVIFKNAFSVAPYTIASTTSLFTSLYPNTHQVTRWQRKIPDGLTTIADIMRQNDYVTYASGFIMGWAHKGFMETFDLDIHTKGKMEQNLYTFLKDKFAKDKNGLPAFIYIHLRPPHAPYDPPEAFDKWSDPEKRAAYADLLGGTALADIEKGERSISQQQLQFLIDKYDGNLLWADWLVHQILEGLEEFGLIESSLIILASDHGEAFLEHGKLSHNSTVYNEMIKIPLIIKFPSYISPKNQFIDAYMENIDLLPTLLDFLQIESPNRTIQGKSLLPLIFNDVKQLKLHLYSQAFWGGVFCLYDSQYKYVQIFEKGELYHTKSDPLEKINIAFSNPILFGYYKSLAHFYRQELKNAHLMRPAEVELDDDTIKKLRSLGYLQ